MRSTGRSLRAPLRALLTLAFTATGAAAATPDYAHLPANWTALANDSVVTPAAPETADTTSEDITPNRNYVLPALEIVGFDALLNWHNRNYVSDDYKSTLSSIRRNLHSRWDEDRDPFTTNQLGHPYQGSMYFGFARSAGLGFWESLGYTFAGSALWEIAGENTPPSKNDQINTGIGGAFLGETLFRMASLVLEHDNVPPFWRELGAAVISPATGFNRLAFGDRFDAVFPSHDPAYYSRLNLGYSRSTQNEAGTSATTLQRNEALVDYSLDYGLPGKPGYTYTRPFDYFTFQGTASSANAFENLMIRGLLVGRDYDVGPDYRGIYGVYGTYDYIAPQTFRVSSTGAALGTTGQWWATESIALQGSALFGGGYAAVGATHSTSDLDYNYGLAPEALVSLRLIYANRVSIDVTGREYFVSHVAAGAHGGHDNIVRLDAGLTYRVYGRHGITFKYLGNRRDSNYPGVGEAFQSRSTLGIFYTFLGHDGLGAVDWR